MGMIDYWFVAGAVSTVVGVALTYAHLQSRIELNRKQHEELYENLRRELTWTRTLIDRGETQVVRRLMETENEVRVIKKWLSQDEQAEQAAPPTRSPRAWQ